MNESSVGADDMAGDGTTTATVLAQALVREGLRNVAAGANPIALKRGIEAAVAAVVASLIQAATPVEEFELPAGHPMRRGYPTSMLSTPDGDPTLPPEQPRPRPGSRSPRPGATGQPGQLRQELGRSSDGIAAVAWMSAGDASVGEIIAEAMDKVGKEGVITVEESNTFGLELELTEGMRFDKGYIAAYFWTDPERMEAVLDEPYILIVNSKISAVKDLLPVLEKVMQSGKPLLIIAEDVEGEALATLIVNKVRGTFASVAVKAPGFGEQRMAQLTDIAILAGGEVISEDIGFKLDGVTLDLLGRARKVVVTKWS